MKKFKIVLFSSALLLIFSSGFSVKDGLHTLNLNSAADVKKFFKYEPNDIPFVCSHRGGPAKDYPENCIETFEHTLKSVHSLMEIDPHYTKDSLIVLMHDPTLNRTSNGKGKVSDYTLNQLKEYRLKDTEGNLTNKTIPTLDEALQWAKGKTLLVLDMKDVPIEVRVKKVVENNAENAAIVMAYSIEDAKKCYALDKNIVMEVMLNSLEKVKDFDESGVPWGNVVVFVSHNLPINKQVIDAVHQRGAMTIIGSSRNVDADFVRSKISIEQLQKEYESIIANGADVIEADLGIEAGLTLQKMRPEKSMKDKFFN